MGNSKIIEIGKILEKANTGLDAIKRAPIVEYDSGIKCLRIQDVSQSKKFDDWGFAEVSQNNFEKFQLKKGDVIVARTGATIGVNRYITDDINSVFNNGLIRLKVNESKCISKYLYYNLQSYNYWGYIDGISGGTSTQPNMQINALLKYEILLPTLPEQKAIASILSSLDDKIDLLHQQNQTLEALAETLFRKWFIEEAKEDWEEKTLFEVIDLIGGGTPKTSVNEYWDGNIGWLSAGDITQSHKGFVVNTEKCISELGLKNSSAKLLPKYATVISARGTVGKYCILSKPMTYSQSNYGILPKFKDCFFFTYLMIANAVNELQASAYGSVFDTITSITFKSINVLIPEENEILTFEQKVSIYFKKILSNQQQIQTLSKLRDTLLPKLMSGEVKINI